MTIKNPHTCTECEAPLKFNRRRNHFACPSCKKISKVVTNRQSEHPLSNLLGNYRLGMEWLTRKL